MSSIRQDDFIVLTVHVPWGVSPEGGFAMRDTLNAAGTDFWQFHNPGMFSVYFRTARSGAGRAQACREAIEAVRSKDPSLRELTITQAEGLLVAEYDKRGRLDSMPMGLPQARDEASVNSPTVGPLEVGPEEGGLTEGARPQRLGSAPDRPPGSLGRMTSIRIVRFGVLFSLLAITFGFTMGALFGAFEPSLKGHLKAEGDAALATKYGGDAAKLKPVLDKSWVYFQRAHLHGGAIGAVALGLCLLLASLSTASVRLRAAAGLLAGVGALGYAVYWLLAGLRAPGLGGTDAAKASLEWLAIPTSGMAIVGLLLTLGLTIRALFGPAGSTHTAA